MEEQEDVFNCSRNDLVPSAYQLWSGIRTPGIAVISVAAALTLFVTACYVDVCRYIGEHVSRPDRRTWLRWTAGLYTVMAWTSLGGLLVPRAAVLTDLVASAYLAVCLLFFFRLALAYYGDGSKLDVERRVSWTCAARGERLKLQLRAPPCCCCCFCLPQLDVTKDRLKKLSVAVLQVAIVTPLVAYVTAILLLDGSYVNDVNQANSANLYLSLILAASTLTAMYALQVFTALTDRLLPERRARLKMGVLQLCLLASNIQPLIFSIMATYDVFPCAPPLSSQARGRAYHLCLLIVEMSLLAVLTRGLWKQQHDSDVKAGAHAVEQQPGNGTVQSKGDTPRDGNENKGGGDINTDESTHF